MAGTLVNDTEDNQVHLVYSHTSAANHQIGRTSYADASAGVSNGVDTNVIVRDQVFSGNLLQIQRLNSDHSPVP